MAKVGAVRDGVQLSGKWEWKDDPANPTLEFISFNPTIDRQDPRRRPKAHDGKGRGDSFNPNADRQDKRRRGKGHDGKGRGDRASSGMQRGGMMGRGRGAVALANPLAKSAPSKKDQCEHTTVTLDVIKSVAFERMSEVDPIPEHFSGLLRREQLNVFLLYLLSYFNCYFNKINLENKKNPMYIEPSKAEIAEIANASERLSVAQKLLGRAYCILVLGLGLDEQHHMECGGSRVSKTYTDRSMFETLYSYSTFVVWITFRRRDFDGVKKEIGRILRSNTFNPAIRVKYAPEEPKEVDPTKVSKKEESTEEKKEPEQEKKLTPAEYRRLHPKRPAIKSIINQRSPAIVSILPSPKEEAHWLFRQTKIMNAELEAQALEEDGLETIDEKYSDLIINTDTFKTGILGEPYKMFNPQTLSPQGAENEDEENEGEDGEKGSSEEGQNAEKAQASDHGTSRNPTAVSHATTEGFADDEP